MIEIPGIAPAWRVALDEEDNDIFARVVANLGASAEQVELREGTLHLAAELAAATAGRGDDAAITAVAGALVGAAIDGGSTGVSLDGAAQRWLARALSDDLRDELGGDVAARIIDAAGRGAASFAGAEPALIVEGTWLTTGRMRSAERRLADDLAARAGELPGLSEVASLALDDVVRRPARFGNQAVVFHALQLEAIRAACTRRVCVISGGPGTGKTSIVVAVLRVLARMGVGPEQVALAAPTGKAAQRMTEAVGEGLGRVLIDDRTEHDTALLEAAPEARTIHRLLGYRPGDGSWTWHHAAPLEARVVVHDEGSMVPLEHMVRVVDALRDDARLIVLGDADQLPSVAAGAVFRDLAHALPGAAVRLTQSYRMREDDERGRAILGAANAVNVGDGEPLLSAPVRAGVADVAWHGVERLAEDAWDELLAAWFSRDPVAAMRALDEPLVRTSDGLDDRSQDAVRLALEIHARGRILCVTRRLPRGSDDVNRRLRAMAAEQIGARPGGSMVAGEPVVVRRNDYDLGLFNGDHGAVVLERDAVSGAVARRVAFARADRVVTFAWSRLEAMVEPGYALTVHRAQGSEYGRVVLALPREDSPLLTREIVYTALTRAQHAALVVASDERVRDAVGRDAGRRTALAVRLREAMSRHE